MKWNFPAIKTNRSDVGQLSKVIEECSEFLSDFTDDEQQNADKEAIDILHSAETFLRLRFKNRESVLDELINKTIEKNSARNYYEEECH